MGRKKRRGGDKERIYCWYCERDFASEHELVHHQKEKHLRCPTCHKRMVSTSGLVVHAMQVHKRSVTVPNAIDGREDPKIDVFGMQGIPVDTGMNGHRAKRQQLVADAAQRQTPFYPSATPVSSAAVTSVPDAPPPGYSTVGYASSYATPTTLPYIAPQQISQPIFPTPQYPSQHVPGGSSFGMQNVYQSSRTPPIALPAWVTRGTYGAPQTFHVQGGASSSFTGQNSFLPAAPSKQLTPVPRTASGAPEVSSGRLPQSAPPAPPQSRNGQVRKQVHVVFDRDDVCMEELRALLPKYVSSLAGHNAQDDDCDDPDVAGRDK